MAGEEAVAILKVLSRARDQHLWPYLEKWCQSEFDMLEEQVLTNTMSEQEMRAAIVRMDTLRWVLRLPDMAVALLQQRQEAEENG